MYRSRIDFVVSAPCPGHPSSPVQVMAIKCAAGSLGSRKREILAAVRIADHRYQIPMAVASDGKTAIVLDTVSGKKSKEGLGAIPTRLEAGEMLSSLVLQPLPEKRLGREKLIFKSYDSDDVNGVEGLEG